MLGRLRCSRSLQTLALAILLLATLPGLALAADDRPDFYGTIVGVGADRGTITITPDGDQPLVIDVRQLGSQPWDQGAFAMNNVVLLHTMRVGNTLVATGWEQARDGSKNFNGVERVRTDKERNKNR